MIVGLILTLLVPISTATDRNCDFYQELTMGTEYFIYNPEYPRNYRSSSSCRWIGKSPENSVIVATCTIDIPTSRYCRREYVSISLTGNSELDDATNFCGYVEKTFITRNNSLVIGLFSSYWSFGGNFVCSLTAVGVKPAPPPTPGPIICNCGWTYESRIVGGQNAEVNKYPSMAVLINQDTYEGYCGASIISDTYALTAAHCLRGKQPKQLLLSVGDYDLSQDDDISVQYQIANFLIHPEYNVSTQQNDIAILQTAEPIIFTPYIGPICLPFRYTWMDFYAQKVTALGWGFMDFSGNKSDILQKVDLSIVSNRDCDAVIPEPVFEKQICTYAPNKDTCLSDSGGPLLWNDPRIGKLYLIGIISFGIGCATMRPAVNTRVTSYLEWVVSMTTDAVYCIK